MGLLGIVSSRKDTNLIMFPEINKFRGIYQSLDDL